MRKSLKEITGTATVTARKEQPDIEFLREITDRFFYWNERSETDPECANFADGYRRMIHALTSDGGE